MSDEKTRSGKSTADEMPLRPLVPEPMCDAGCKRWIDAGTPDNTAHEYPGWR